MFSKFKRNTKGPSIHLSELIADIPDFSLDEVLKDPMLLAAFEDYLTQTWSQENLLFIEAMNQLRHESGTPEDIEKIFTRIYDTFVVLDAPLELNVNTQESVKDQLQSLRWSVITRDDALDLLKETEQEVLSMLRDKLTEFLRTPRATISSNKSKINTGPMSILQKRVVIIGGGFTGFSVGSALDPMPLFHVTLIDTKDSFEYTPQIVSKVVNAEKISSLRFTHGSYIVKGKVIIGYVEDICEDAKCVKVNDEKIYFDYLVIGTGSSYSCQLKSSDSSSLYRTAGLDKIATEIENAKHILIVGAGLVGCELAAAIGKKQQDALYSVKKQIVLIEARDKIIYRADEKQRKRAEEYLASLGIEILVNERITTCNTQDYNVHYGSSGNKYSEQDFLVLMATGVKLNTSFILTSTNEPPLDTCIDVNGSVRVRPTLQIEHWKYNHIFAGGDVTNVIEEKTAYAATLAGVCIARNICRMEKGKDPIAQGTKGLLAPPTKTLHGVESQGGLGKKRLSFFERKLSFLNPTWQVLKYFNEKQFFKIVQETSKKSSILGKFPKTLTLPDQTQFFRPEDGSSSSAASSRIDLLRKDADGMSNDRHLLSEC
ncbi:hypothetical protein EDC94DRAFT_607507 [Helicostylum pulchrum]|nr:hypothetical protein EDC94DRAFT_607507 [Helicostylum pulchrum]